MISENLPLRDPRFIVTLPFDENQYPRYVTDRVLHCTRRSWQWFVNAQISYPVLGTLGYLPFEVRSMIWQFLLHCRATLSSDGIWEYEPKLGPVFDLGAYYFGFGQRSLLGNKAQNLRLVSSALKQEYEDIFLTGRTFRFNYGQNLGTFTDDLSRLGRKNPVRRIELGYGTFSVLHMLDFVQPMANLWHGLREIDIIVYGTSMAIFEKRGNEKAWGSLRNAIEGASKSASRAKITVRIPDEDSLSGKCEAVVKATLESISQAGTHQTLDTSIVPFERDECL